jgi:hypothetical protein
MGRKAAFNFMPMIVIIAVLAVVGYLALRPDSSPIAKGVQWISSQIEGFTSPILDTPKCPDRYRFFNDDIGESFCCKGNVNPYTHRCEGKDNNNLCAFKEGVKDPRKRDGSILPSCNSMITKTHTDKQDKLCPGSKPNYASIGKCCTMGADMDGYDCSDYDNADSSRYCVLGEPTRAGERRCSDLQMSEGVKCPDGMNISWYGLGQREAKKYGASANNTWLPVCMSIDHTCIPDSVLSHVQQTRGLYTDKKAEEWKYSCSGYNKRYVERDFTAQLDNSYP